MKKCLIVTLTLFFAAFMNSYCFALNPSQEVALHQAGKKENYEFSGKLENGIRVIVIKASRYKFEPSPIVVKLGERVRLILSSTDVAHGLAIPQFQINVSIPPGRAETVEFVADKKGEFPAYCSVYCGPGHSHMHTTFIVK